MLNSNKKKMKMKMKDMILKNMIRSVIKINFFRIGAEEELRLDWERKERKVRNMERKRASV
jgi:hypothetical protein